MYRRAGSTKARLHDPPIADRAPAGPAPAEVDEGFVQAGRRLKSSGAAASSMAPSAA